MKIRHFRIAPAAAALIMVAVAGCSGGSSGPTQASAVSANINLAVVPSVNNTPAYITQYEGFFAQQGLHVNIKSMASSAVAISDQLAGSIDIVAGAYQPYIAKQAKKAQFTILAEGSTMGAGDRTLLTRPGSPITSLRQLVGKTVGLEATDSIGTLLVSAALQENGIAPSSVHFVTSPTGFKGMAKDLAAGKYDAAFFGEPFGTQAEEQYGDVVLATLGQGATQGLPFSGFTATKAWVSSHKDVAAAFVRAVEQGQLIAATNTTILRRDIEKSDALPPVVGSAIALPGFPVGPINVTRLQRGANAILQFNELDQKYAGIVRDGSLIRSMIDPDLQAVISSDPNLPTVGAA